jgi:hypothetical protein
VTISVPKEDPTAKTYTVVSSVAKNLKPGGTDCIYEAYETYRLSKIASVLGPICFGVGGVIAIVCFVILMCLSGYHTEEVESRYEVYRAKKVEAPEKKKLKKVNVVKNTTFESKAEKSLAALVKIGKLDAEGIEVRDYNEGELSLIFEQQYQKFSPDELKRELKSIMRRVMEERATEERKELEEEIRKAEEAGDDAKVGELMQKMSKLLRKK